MQASSMVKDYKTNTFHRSVDYLAYRGPEEAELSLWTGFMQEAASGLRRTSLLRTRVNMSKKQGRFEQAQKKSSRKPRGKKGPGLQ